VLATSDMLGYARDEAPSSECVSGMHQLLSVLCSGCDKFHWIDLNATWASVSIVIVGHSCIDTLCCVLSRSDSWNQQRPQEALMCLVGH
jgi:hypothetical protein